jgi:hypothetical protein
MPLPAMRNTQFLYRMLSTAQLYWRQWPVQRVKEKSSNFDCRVGASITPGCACVAILDDKLLKK